MSFYLSNSLAQIIKKVTLFSPLFELTWIISSQHIFDIGMYTNWQKHITCFW